LQFKKDRTVADDLDDDPLLNSQFSENEEAFDRGFVSHTPESSKGLPSSALGTRSQKAVTTSFQLPPEWFKFYNDKYMLSKATFAFVLPTTEGKIQCACLDVRCFTKVNFIIILQFFIFTIHN
jgi:hypothetical protein